MSMHKKLLAVGALTVTLLASGAVALANTTPGTQSTSPTKNAYRTQLQAERQQLKTLWTERKQLNEEIKTEWQSLKGKHVWKNNQSLLQTVKATHQEILAARTKLQTEVQTNRADRSAKNWSQLVVDLQYTQSDLQQLISLKQQQLSHLQSVSIPNSSTNNNEANSSTGATA